MPNNIERDLFIVIWKTNQYLISWRVIRFHFTVCILFLFYNSWAELWPTFFSFLQEHLVAFQVKGEKHPRGGGSLLWCQVASSDILSFFKLILGVMQLETDLICSQRFLLFFLHYSISASLSFLISRCNTLMLLNSTAFPAVVCKIVCHVPRRVNKNGAVNR